MQQHLRSWPTFSQPPVCPCVSTVCWPGLLVPALMYSQGRSSPASAEDQKVKSESDIRASDTQTSVEKLPTPTSRSRFPTSSQRCDLHSGLWANSFERALKGKHLNNKKGFCSGHQAFNTEVKFALIPLCPDMYNAILIQGNVCA